MNKTLLSWLSFTFVLTCSSHNATWLCSNHQWCSISDNGFLFQKSMTVMGDHHFHNIVSKCNIPFAYYQPSKTSCFAGSASLISHPLVPTMTFLLSFHCFSIQVQNSHPSPFEFLLHRVHAPVAEHCWHHHYDHDEYKYCYCFCNWPTKTVVMITNIWTPISNLQPSF